MYAASARSVVRRVVQRGVAVAVGHVDVDAEALEELEPALPVVLRGSAIASMWPCSLRMSASKFAAERCVEQALAPRGRTHMNAALSFSVSTACADARFKPSRPRGAFPGRAFRERRRGRAARAPPPQPPPPQCSTSTALLQRVEPPRRRGAVDARPPRPTAWPFLSRARGDGAPSTRASAAADTGSEAGGREPTRSLVRRRASRSRGEACGLPRLRRGLQRAAACARPVASAWLHGRRAPDRDQTPPLRRATRGDPDAAATSSVIGQSPCSGRGREGQRAAARHVERRRVALHLARGPVASAVPARRRVGAAAVARPRAQPGRSEGTRRRPPTSRAHHATLFEDES